MDVVGCLVVAVATGRRVGVERVQWRLLVGGEKREGREVAAI